jgi:hypothetical protein
MLLIRLRDNAKERKQGSGLEIACRRAQRNRAVAASATSMETRLKVRLLDKDSDLPLRRGFKPNIFFSESSMRVDCR